MSENSVVPRAKARRVVNSTCHGGRQINSMKGASKGLWVGNYLSCGQFLRGFYVPRQGTGQTIRKGCAISLYHGRLQISLLQKVQKKIDNCGRKMELGETHVLRPTEQKQSSKATLSSIHSFLHLRTEGGGCLSNVSHAVLDWEHKVMNPLIIVSLKTFTHNRHRQRENKSLA